MVIVERLLAGRGLHREPLARRIDGDCTPLHQRYTMIGLQCAVAECNATHRQRSGEHETGEYAGDRGRVRFDQRHLDVTAPKTKLLGDGGAAEAAAHDNHAPAGGRGADCAGKRSACRRGTGRLEKLPSVEVVHVGSPGRSVGIARRRDGGKIVGDQPQWLVCITSRVAVHDAFDGPQLHFAQVAVQVVR